ncbi:MAG: hypothetical protein K2Q18_19660 [Bdellovibrionales bacterium]|nr:hypothetical protein [Bdellovibrionales bacterium]
MKKIKLLAKIISFCLIPICILYVVSIVYDPFSSCPVAFRFEYETNCWLRDERDGVKLIELFNSDNNGLWLAKVSKDVIWIEHPIDHLDSYKKSISENIIKFSDDKLDELLVNGEKFPIKVLPSRPTHN